MYPDLLERCGLFLHKMVPNDCALIFLTSFLCWSVSNSNSSSKCNFTHVTKSVCSRLNLGSYFSIRISRRLGRQIQAVQKVHAKWTKWAQPSDLCLCCGFLTIKEMSASTECHEWGKKRTGRATTTFHAFLALQSEIRMHLVTDIHVKCGIFFFPGKLLLYHRCILYSVAS